MIQSIKRAYYSVMRWVLMPKYRRAYCRWMRLQDNLYDAVKHKKARAHIRLQCEQEAVKILRLELAMGYAATPELSRITLCDEPIGGRHG